MGEVPVWYALIQAARYLRVAPWDLASRPVWWLRVAQAAQSAEASAERIKQSRKGGRNAESR